MSHIPVAVGIFCVCMLSCLPQAVPNPSSADYLCEIGVNYYRAGRFDEALYEFNKALMIQPDNQTARTYIGIIFREDVGPLSLPAAPAPKIAPVPAAVKPTPVAAPVMAPVAAPVAVPPVYTPPPPKIVSAPASVAVSTPDLREAAVEEPSPYVRDAMINQALAQQTGRQYASSAGMSEKPLYPEMATPAELTNPIKITGEAQLRFGFASQDAVWKQANWDLNEKNFRMLSDNAFDRHVNTFDPRIYDRVRVNIGTKDDQGFSFFSNITVDPWSFTGRSRKVTVGSFFFDTADVELKYWANTGYTVNETIQSNLGGNVFTLPEMKVQSGKTQPIIRRGQLFPIDLFSIPELKIDRTFQPLRELVLQYKQDAVQLKVFPIAYENQAITFEDPLRLSNNRMWWEDSPWLHSWKKGIFNSAVAVPDFTKGYWDNTLSFFTRDSEGQRLTALRGFSFDFSPQDATRITTSVAAPKDLWQDYSEVDNFLSATRITHALRDNFSLGLIATTRAGYDTEGPNKLDASNQVYAADAAYEIVDGLKAAFEVAHSQSAYDITNARFKTEANGSAYMFSLLGRFPLETIMDTKYGYDGIQPGQGESFFTKFKFFLARMDHSFDASLSSYIETRDDEFWARHLHFRKPFTYYYQGEGQLLSWDDIKNYGVGNGVDIGRSTIGLRVQSSLWDKKVDNFFDVRNVHDTNGDFVENVARNETTAQINDKLTAKLLTIYQRLPHTVAGVDPFIFNPLNRTYYVNANILDGEDPSIATGSLGLEYSFFDWLALNGIWEYTNDSSLAYDNFPRVILNDFTPTLFTSQYDNIYRDMRRFVYDQGLFPAPPYSYYNIFKTGLRVNPMENMQIYLDYTRNPYELAGQVDDNMNHVGLEIAYSPMKKLSVFLRYTYSRWQDLDMMTHGITEMFSHHNAFFEVVYRRTQNDDFSFQYGEASRDPYMGGVLDIGWDPYGGSLRTIDTQHIYRLYYRRKF